MTVLRLERILSANADPAIATLDGATLVRRQDGSFADVAEIDVPRAVRALAYAGVRAIRCDSDLAVPPGLVPALGRDLAPLGTAVALDVVQVRRLSLGAATEELLRRSLVSRRADSAVDRARDLLRAEDSLIAWARRAWATREVLRSVALRRSLRPVVFDRAVLERSDLDGRSFATSGALTRWLFA